MQYFIHTHCIRKDGTKDTFATYRVPHKMVPIPQRGQTSTGCGNAVPTSVMVKWLDRWHRVKRCGGPTRHNLFIGKTYDETLRVTYIEEVKTK